MGLGSWERNGLSPGLCGLGNLAHGRVGMAPSRWEFLPYTSVVLFQMPPTSSEKPQSSSRHLFPLYVVVCVPAVE